jgi:transcriptional regulator with XRE-family HTH domain
VKFAQKLENLTEGMNKSQLARDAGLKSTAISNYINQPDTIPRADIAVRIARVLKVPVEWLVDESQDFPLLPPGGDLAAFSTSELMDEVAKRYLDVALQCRDTVQELYGTDWLGVATQLCKMPLEDDLPEDMVRLIDSYISIVELNEFKRRGHVFDIVRQAAKILLKRGEKAVIHNNIDIEELDYFIRGIAEGPRGLAVRYACQLRGHWEEAKKSPTTRESFEKHRSKILEKLRGLDRQSTPGNTGNTK